MCDVSKTDEAFHKNWLKISWSVKQAVLLLDSLLSSDNFVLFAVYP